ncbi:MAG: acyl-CoA dehydrogenase [bacterium]
MTYTAPIRDLMFAATELADLDGVSRLPGFEDATPELLHTILDEAGKFAAEVLAPINASGDRQGVRLEDGNAITADGWKEAYRSFIDGGWNGLPFDPAVGGQGLPWLVSTAVAEIWHAANMSFSLCPLLTQAAIEAIATHGSEQQKATYLPKLVSGEWAGTMNPTEPQAGSDLSAVRARAVPAGAHHLISGQKIFITYGDHDLTDNIIHLVLARTPDAPDGVKGISLFIVPKYLPDDDGEWRVRNDIETVALEHKLGIHASPTAALAYGSNDGAVGYLVGEENHGLVYMFTMMNLARHSVGIEGNGVAERAYQQAAAFAAERIQGRAVDDPDPDGARVPIIAHPDIKRMLLLQKCRIESLRSLILAVAGCMDHAQRQLDSHKQAAAREMVEIMIPIVKGYATEVGLENVSLALQVHGGMGFIEETGAAQHYRDQRITPIYEGTTGIQAMDLIGRKLMRDDGAMNARVIARIRAECAALAAAADAGADVSADAVGDAGADEIAPMFAALSAALDALERAAKSVLQSGGADMRLAAAVGEPYLRLWGVVACGWQMLKAAAVSAAELRKDGQDEDPFHCNKLRTAKFYFATELPKASGLAEMIDASAELVAEADADSFAVF